MKRKRIVVALLAAIMLLQTTTAFGTVIKETKVEVKTKHVKKVDQCMLVDLKIPVFCGLGNKAAEVKLNRSIEDGLVKNYKTLYKEAVSFHKAASKDKSLHFLKYEVSSVFKVPFNGKNLTSLMLSTYDFTGGAHGNPGVICYNIDKKTGKNIPLKDLFKEGVDYKALLNPEVAEQIKSRDAAVYTFESVQENEAYYIKGDKLYLVFQSYEIAPYSEGQPTFGIPLSKLAQSLILEVK